MIRLSLHCGRWDWENVLNEITPRQLNVLMAYGGIEPWGDDRADIRMGVQTASTVSAFGAKSVEIEGYAKYLQIHEDDERAAASPNKAADYMRGVFGD